MLGKNVRITINFSGKRSEEVRGILERRDLDGSSGYYVGNLQIPIDSRITHPQKIYLFSVYPRKLREVYRR